MLNDALFPFVAIVGQENVKKALLIALVNQKAGGLLIGGKKGTAKSTIVRGVRELCGEQRIVELPLNATEDMLFGSIDVEYAVKHGKRKFASGILARAHENLLYIDEINLLRTELLNAVLDANAAGVNLVERDGISFSHPVHCTVLGTMNPEEGTLSSQTLDRFGMYVEAQPELVTENRVKIMRELLNFAADIEGYRQQNLLATESLAEQIAAARTLVKITEVSEAMIQLAAQMCAQAFCAGHRAEIYLLECAKAIAALEQRNYVLPKDMNEAAQYVLPHRMRRPPEQEQPEEEETEQQNEQENEDNTEDNDETQDENDADDQQQPPPPLPDNVDGENDEEPENDDQSEDDEQNEDKEEPTPNNDAEAQEQVADIDKTFPLPQIKLDLDQDRKLRRGSGKRSTKKTDLKQGRYVRATISSTKVEDLAFDATIRAAAPYQKMRENNGCALNIKSEDMRQKVREKRIGSTFLFLVDASGSMGAKERMKAVKGAIFYMLQEAYQKRDQVGMIAFRRTKAEVLLPITRSIDLAQKCLQELPTGGKTPLADGLATALMTLYMRNKKDAELEPILILVTDGRANFVDASGEDPIKQAIDMAQKIGKLQISSVVIDTETDFIKLGIAKDVAKAMGASYYSLKQLSEEQIIHIVRNIN